MNKTQRNYRIIEKFCETKFKNAKITCELFEHKQSSGFYFNQKKYFLDNTLIFYQIERPDGFKIAFDSDLLREVHKYVPVRGYKQHLRKWLFKNMFADFPHKDKLLKKFSYYD